MEIAEAYEDMMTVQGFKTMAKTILMVKLVVGVKWKPAAWEQCHQLPPSSELNSPERKRERLVRTILIVSQEWIAIGNFSSQRKEWPSIPVKCITNEIMRIRSRSRISIGFRTPPLPKNSFHEKVFWEKSIKKTRDKVTKFTWDKKKNRTSGKQDVVYKNHNIATKESHGVKCSGNQK